MLHLSRLKAKNDQMVFLEVHKYVRSSWKSGHGHKETTLFLHPDLALGLILFRWVYPVHMEKKAAIDKQGCL